MDKIQLLHLTRNTRIDQIIKAIIGFYELLFPGRIGGYYLLGSYATGDATAVSDIDLTPLFRGDFASDEERQRAWQVDTFSEWMVGRSLDIIPATEASLSHAFLENAVANAILKYGSILVYGYDFRPQIQAPSHWTYTRSALFTAFRALAWHHYHPNPVEFPLSYPDSSHEFYGFNQWGASIDEKRRTTTERLVYSVIRIAGARVALKSDRTCYSKYATVQAYTDAIQDEWTEFVIATFYNCHERWQYTIPNEAADRHLLRNLYKQALEFENNFLDIYYELLLEDLGSREVAIHEMAAKQLAGIRKK
jgi:hypothetical protein